MVPYKRPAADKSGVPVYQPNATTYQQLMQLQQPFVPVSCEYSTSPAPPPTSSCASPTVPEASQSHASSPVSQASQISQITLHQQQQQQQQHQQSLQQSIHQSKKEAETVTLTTTTAAMPVALPPQPQIPDPATLAKEVAQQNYAKAIKLAAVNQSIAASQFTHLNPLNYTGVSLNKQALNAVQQQNSHSASAAAHAAAAAQFQRYPQALPFQFNATAMNLGLANPYQAIAQQNLLNMSRHQPQMQLNPYHHLIRQQPYSTNAGATANHHQLYANSLLNAHQYPVTVSAPPMTNNTQAQANMAAAAAQNNNNNVVLQPYKKLKTN